MNVSAVFSQVLRVDAFPLASLVAVWWSFRGERLFGHVNQSVGRRNRCAVLPTALFSGMVVGEGSWRWLTVPPGGCVHTLTGHQSLTSGMELRNNILVSGNADSTVRVWDVRTGHCLHTLQGMCSDIGQIFTMFKWLCFIGTWSMSQLYLDIMTPRRQLHCDVIFLNIQRSLF